MHLDSAGPKLCVPEVLAASDIFLAKQPLLPDGPAGAMEQKITVAMSCAIGDFHTESLETCMESMCACDPHSLTKSLSKQGRNGSITGSEL